MRLTLISVALLLSACGIYRPGAMPTVTNWADQAALRNEQARRSSARAVPDKRKSLSATAKNVATAAATVAILAGLAFSGSGSATMGMEGAFDENELIEGKKAKPVESQPASERPAVFGPSLDEKN